MPDIVPLLSAHMVDGKEQVTRAAYNAMVKVSEVVGNKDIEAFVPELVSCIVRPTEVPECIHKLSGITFVQAVRAPALSIMVPLLVRGMKERATVVKRKTVVIIDNMSRLVDDPIEAAPFLDVLIPGVERVSQEVADPECRATAAKVVATLTGMKAEVAARGGEDLHQKAEPAVVASILKNMITSSAREETEEPLFAVTIDYISRMCSTLIVAKNFEFEGSKSLLASLMGGHLSFMPPPRSVADQEREVGRGLLVGWENLQVVSRRVLLGSTAMR